MCQMTLRMARNNCRLTIGEAAKKAGISPGTLRRWEIDNSGARGTTAMNLLKVYGVSFNHVYFGKEVDALERIRMMFDNDFKEVL